MGHCPSTLLKAPLVARLRLRQGRSLWHCQRLTAIFSTFNSFNRPQAIARTLQNPFECALWASVCDSGKQAIQNPLHVQHGYTEPASSAAWLLQFMAMPHSLRSPPQETVWMQPLPSRSSLLFSLFSPALQLLFACLRRLQPPEHKAQTADRHSPVYPANATTCHALHCGRQPIPSGKVRVLPAPLSSERCSSQTRS